MLLITLKDGKSLKFDPAEGHTQRDFERLFNSVRNDSVECLEVTGRELQVVLKSLDIASSVLKGMDMVESALASQAAEGTVAGKIN